LPHFYSTENSEEPFFFAIFAIFCGQFIFGCGHAALGEFSILRRFRQSQIGPKSDSHKRRCAVLPG